MENMRHHVFSFHEKWRFILPIPAEIGISTSKLHAYGPMGAESLTTEKFIVMGDGEVRD